MNDADPSRCRGRTMGRGQSRHKRRTGWYLLAEIGEGLDPAPPCLRSRVRVGAMDHIADGCLKLGG